MYVYTISHPHAVGAILAAELRSSMGAASYAFAERFGCPRSLYVLACQLKAAQKVKEVK